MEFGDVPTRIVGSAYIRSNIFTEILHPSTKKMFNIIDNRQLLNPVINKNM